MFSKNVSFCIAVCFVFVFVSFCFASTDNLPYASDRILVKFAPKFGGVQRSTIERNAILSARKAGSVKCSLGFIPGLSVVELPKDVNVPDALKLLKNDPNIEYAEPDWILHLGSTYPNDLHFGEQWGLHNTGGQHFHEGGGYTDSSTEDADIDSPEAWEIIHDANDEIVVAIIDSGIDYAHEDLRDNLWDDGQGHCGHTYLNGGSYESNDPCDDNYHGTHIAGIIAAHANNSKGVAGVCWRAKIMAIKTFNSQMVGYSSDVIRGINYAIDNGAKIINASWYYDQWNPYFPDINASNALKQAIDNADANGILFIASAGNAGINNDAPPFGYIPSYPASYDCNNIIAVMATDKNDYIASMPAWSNYGPNSVDIAAPGEEIYSTMPHNVTAGMWYTYQGQQYHLDTDYALLDGTSMSAAYISGACALLWSHMNSLPEECNYLDVKNTILNTAEKLPVLTGKCRIEGRLNLNNAITNTIPTPKARITGGGAYPIIQDAVDAATDGDEIVLDKGTYYQNVDLDDKELIIRSIDPNNPAVVANTLICAQTYQRVFDLDRNVGTTLTGLTISHSKDIVGFPVYVQDNSNVTISKCELFSPLDGTCIYSQKSTVDVVGCRIHGDRTSTCGVSADVGTTTVRNCLIYDCYKGICTGGGISMNIRNSTIVNNTNTGIYLNHSSYYPTYIRNCIIWGNGTQIYDPYPNVTYCCVDGNFPGTGNFDSNPCFVAPDVNDFHLLFNSPCINAGNPDFTPLTGETDIDSDERILGRDSNGNLRVDMGADEYWVGDFNHDGIVNFKDFANLAKFWMLSSQLYDLDGNGTINYYDLDIFTGFWLSTNSTYVPGGGDQMQGDGLGDDLESESLLDDEGGQATISLVCDVNDPNEGDEVTVYVHTDMPLYALWYMDITVTGDADIIDAMNYYTIDCNAYGWSEGFALDSFIDDANGVVEIGGIAWPSEANDIVGYFTFRYNSGQVSASITDGWADDTTGLAQFSQEILLFGRDPNEP